MLRLKALAEHFVASGKTLVPVSAAVTEINLVVNRDHLVKRFEL